MPQPVQLKKSEDIEEGTGGQTAGMIRSNALVGVSDKVCASVMLAKPHSSSAIHHHGEQDTVVYAAAGRGTIVSEGGKKRQDLKAGDFALIPAFSEHQEVNDSDEDVTWIITRSGGKPIVQNLEDWGKS